MSVRPFLISLDQSPAVRAGLQSLFPVPITQIGIDGRRLPASEYFRLNLTRVRDGQILLTPAELGCALSHLRVLEDFLASSADVAVIFEDDVIVRLEPADDLPGFLQLAAGYDLVMLGDQQAQAAMQLLYGWRKPDEGVQGHPFWEIPRKFQRYLKQAAAYAVNRSFAEYLVRQQHEMIGYADGWRTWLVTRSCRVGYAPVFGHPTDLSASLIEPERLALGGHSGGKAAPTTSGYRRIRSAMRARWIKAEKCV